MRVPQIKILLQVQPKLRGCMECNGEPSAISGVIEAHSLSSFETVLRETAMALAKSTVVSASGSRSDDEEFRPGVSEDGPGVGGL